MMLIWSFPNAGVGSCTPRTPPLDCIGGRNAGAFDDDAESVLPVLSVSEARVGLPDSGKRVLLLAEDRAAAGSRCAGQEMNPFRSSAGAINSSANAMDMIRSVGATDAKCSASRSGGR